ncbi:MAG: nucleotide exchange factor GrpE [Chloroflexota bacterium]
MSDEELLENEDAEVTEPTPEQQEDAEPTLEEQLEAAQAEAAKNLDSALRAQADLVNARKRFEKQRIQAYSNATADLVGKLIPALDDFERAIENAPTAVTEDGWYSGVELVQRKLNTILENFNVKQIDAVGQPFDPNFHEALSEEDSDEYESGVVTRELLKGYKIGDRVIRASLVYVAA